MFDDITRPTIRVRARQWYTVPLSILSHAVLLLALAIVPLLATGTLPTPSSFITVIALARPLPPPVPPPIAPDSLPPPFEPDVTRVPYEPPDWDAFEPLPALRPVVTGIPRAFGPTAPRTRAAPPPPAAMPAPVRVGGEIRPPERLFGPKPVYPAVAKAARMSGVVFLEAVIAVDGRVKNLRVTRSAGVFDQAALEAVREWRYSPTMLNGEAVEVVMSVTVTFTLN